MGSLLNKNSGRCILYINNDPGIRSFGRSIYKNNQTLYRYKKNEKSFRKQGGLTLEFDEKDKAIVIKAMAENKIASVKTKVRLRTKMVMKLKLLKVEFDH